MKKPEKFRKKTMLEAAHEMAQGLCDAGIIGGKTMQEFDDLCLKESSEA